MLQQNIFFVFLDYLVCLFINEAIYFANRFFNSLVNTFKCFAVLVKLLAWLDGRYAL